MYREVAIATMLQYIGAAVLFYFSYKILSFQSLWLLPTRSLAYYRRDGGSWALITGASAGIGRRCAEELAAYGFNVILLGHLSDELDLCKKEINKAFPGVEVKVVVLNVTQASNPKIEQAFADFTTLPINILVNNVGGVPAGLQDFVDYTALEMDRTIDLNCRFMSQCSRIMLPVLANNGPSLMMNLSSIGRLGMPTIVTYSGTKAYVSAVSRGLARECRANRHPVDVVTVIPVEVSTELNTIAQAPGTPTSSQFANATMKIVPRVASRGWLEVSPYWLHAMQMEVMERLPEWLFMTFVLASFNKKKELLGAAKLK